MLALQLCLHETRVFADLGREAAPTCLLALLPAVPLALLLGFSTRVRSGGGLLGRVLGCLFYGGLVVAALGLFVASVDPRAASSDRLAPMMILGATAAGLAVHHTRGLGSEGRRSRLLVTVAALLVFGLGPWAASPALQCLSGRAAACQLAAEDRLESGLGAEGIAYLERGCYRGDPQACSAAASYHQRGAFVPRDLVRAEAFSQRACASGEGSADGPCGALRLVELEDACDHFHVFACKELAASYRGGSSGVRDPSRADRMTRKACLLGDDASCR